MVMVNPESIRISIVLLVTLIQLLFGSALSPSISFAGKTAGQSLPLFADDGDRESLLACALQHRQYLKKLPASHHTTVDGVRYSRARLLNSLDAFIDLVKKDLDPQQFNEQLRARFKVIQAAGKKGKDGEMLITGYYEPLFSASLTRQGPFQYPLYRMPKSLVSRKETGGKTKIGRVGPKGIVPFWTRAEIEGDDQPLAGSELAYLRDPFEVFLLHIQGSGRLELPDGSQRLVRFAGHNGHGYRSIGRLLVDERKLTLQESSIPAIRRYLEHHPEDTKRVLNHNPRYIFFTWNKAQTARGSLGRPLTAGRSIAIDRKALPDTLFGWLETVAPVVDDKGRIVSWQPWRRFVLPQDSGAAIKGPGRVDLFWGHGAYAETAAGTMRTEGRLFFFVKR